MNVYPENALNEQEAAELARQIVNCDQPEPPKHRVDAVEEAMQHYYNRNPEALKALVSRLIKQGV